MAPIHIYAVTANKTIKTSPQRRSKKRVGNLKSSSSSILVRIIYQNNVLVTKKMYNLVTECAKCTYCHYLSNYYRFTHYRYVKKVIVLFKTSFKNIPNFARGAIRQFRLHEENLNRLTDRKFDPPLK